MADLYARVGKRLAEARKAAGWTQEVLAERAGIGTSYVARIESGQRKATLETLDRLATCVGVPLATLLAEPSKRRGPRAELLRDLDSLPAADLKLLRDVARRLRQGRT